MLPILRTISVGGVLLAITILALALSPPGGSHMQFTAVDAPARGALIDAGDHPEWRQLFILAALRRADELNRLRELPDTPVRLPELPIIAHDYLPIETLQTVGKGAAETAGLPAARTDAEPEDETGSINVTPSATIPIEIGEQSSTELPVAPLDDKPPVIGAPLTELSEPDEIQKPEKPAADAAAMAKTEQIKAPAKPKETAMRSVRRHRVRRNVPRNAETEQKFEAPIPFNLLQKFFESLLRPPTAQPKAERSKRTSKPRQSKTIHTVMQ
ncbi:MAG: hypothetical protein K9G60_05510 [Pseudolabrys sp.]|nr:hypothetical protein [Pseudolabrys sp.]